MLRTALILSMVISVSCLLLSPANTVYAEEPSSVEDARYTTLVFNGDPAVKVDIVFIGVGYGDSSAQQQLFASDTNRHMNYLLAVEPFKSYQESFNIYRGDEGLNLEVITKGQTMYVSPSGASSAVAKKGIPYDVIIVLIKSSKWGGGGSYKPRVVCSSSSFPWITLHEFGHSFGGLWDEYIVVDEELNYYPFIELGPNVDWDGSKWADIPGTGAFLGATYKNLYRSAYNCVMRTRNNTQFCPVCKAHLISLLSDSDGDGIVGFVENELGTDPLSSDTDRDNLSDYDEVVEYTTNPATSDTDHDNFGDWAEVTTYHTSPLVADTDEDNLSDYDEVTTYGTSPLIADTDEDNLSDYDEVTTYGTSPLVADTDEDNLPDYDEVTTYGTSPLIADTDEDNLSDYDEVTTYGTSPLVADTDEDNLSDYDEVTTYGTSPLVADTDEDNLSDYDEVTTYGTSPLIADTDGDLWKDSIDPMGRNVFIPNTLVALFFLIGLSSMMVWRRRR